MSKELDTASTPEIVAAPTVAPASSADTSIMAKGVEKLRQHAQMKAMATEYAEFITTTGMCPKTFIGKPNDAAAAIIRGTALGFDPDGALEAFFVINGRVGMYARSMCAVALSVGCTMREVEASDERVTWQGSRPGDDHVTEVTWTIERATKAGYTKSNARYGTNPQEMLRAKCQAELSRMLAPGELMGLYSEIEEEAFAKPPMRTVASQQGQPDRGMDKVRQALAAKSTKSGTVEEWVRRIEEAPSRDELKALVPAAVEAHPDHAETFSSAGNYRYYELEGDAK